MSSIEVTREIISADMSAFEEPADMASMDDASDIEREVENRTLPVSAVQHLQRLDRVLAAGVPELSRSYLQKLLADGAVTLDGQSRLKPSTRVRAGARIEVELRPTPDTLAFRAEAIPLNVVYEDRHLLVIDKPAGLVVHPAPGHWSGTLLNGLLARDPGAAGLARAGIVHRLDKDTSGLMLVGRTVEACTALVRMIAARDVHREYVALAHGAWNGRPGEPRAISAPVGRDPRSRLRMAVVATGKHARTDVTLLEGNDDFCLVHCRLHTGRTHQIRVHMAHIGHPLVGDVLYGGREACGMTRQALHAWRLTLRHPVTGEPLHFESTWPRDFADAVRDAGLGYTQVQ